MAAKSSSNGSGSWAVHEQRAEELVDRFSNNVTETVARAAARAREEAEDLLAEARQLRRSRSPQN